MISRLELETSEEDLKDYLTDLGIEGATCRKLTGKDARTGYEFKTAAFFVSIEAKYREIVYDMDNWPENCAIRDWFTRKKFDINSAIQNGDK